LFVEVSPNYFGGALDLSVGAWWAERFMALFRDFATIDRNPVDPGTWNPTLTGFGHSRGSTCRKIAGLRSVEARKA
jgi:hypothetical protein